MRPSDLCRFGLALALAIGAASASGAEESDPRCARIDARQGYGPYDYRGRRGPTAKQLEIVESNHFQKPVQRAAQRGDAGAVGVWNELDYTLRAFPNHTQALYLLAVFEHTVAKESPEFHQQLQAKDIYSPSGCYFQRARRHFPDDPNVLNVLGRFLTRVGRHEEAIKAFANVVKMVPGSGSAYYNLGLAYYAAERYEDAAKAVHAAAKRGHPGTELRRRLKSKGVLK